MQSTQNSASCIVSALHVGMIPPSQCLVPLSLSVLSPLRISPSPLALNIIYMPMILKFIFPMPPHSRIPNSYTQQPTGHHRLTLSKLNCSSLSPNFLHFQPFLWYLMSTPSLQLFRSPKLGVDLYSSLSLILHNQSVFL